MADIETRLLAFPDRDGRALPMLCNMRACIEAGAGMPLAQADAMLAAAERAVQTGEFLFALPQFLVTATRG